MGIGGGDGWGWERGWERRGHGDEAGKTDQDQTRTKRDLATTEENERRGIRRRSVRAWKTQSACVVAQEAIASVLPRGKTIARKQPTNEVKGEPQSARSSREAPTGPRTGEREGSSSSCGLVQGQGGGVMPPTPHRATQCRTRSNGEKHWITARSFPRAFQTRRKHPWVMTMTGPTLTTHLSKGEPAERQRERGAAALQGAGIWDKEQRPGPGPDKDGGVLWSLVDGAARSPSPQRKKKQETKRPWMSRLRYLTWHTAHCASHLAAAARSKPSKPIVDADNGPGRPLSGAFTRVYERVFSRSFSSSGPKATGKQDEQWHAIRPILAFSCPSHIALDNSGLAVSKAKQVPIHLEASSIVSAFVLVSPRFVHRSRELHRRSFSKRLLCRSSRANWDFRYGQL
ncbi:hypothetical protein VDGL01_02158 [Verticillium dahliae]